MSPDYVNNCWLWSNHMTHPCCSAPSLNLQLHPPLTCGLFTVVHRHIVWWLRRSMRKGTRDCWKVRNMPLLCSKILRRDYKSPDIPMYIRGYTIPHGHDLSQIAWLPMAATMQCACRTKLWATGVRSQATEWSTQFQTKFFIVMLYDIYIHYEL